MVGNLRSLAPALIGAGLVAALASGCGSDGSDGSVALDPSASTPSASPSDSSSDSSSGSPSDSATPSDSPSATTPPDWPSCADVWVEDADLPKPYEGCLDGGVAVEAEALKCSAGVELVTFDDHFWGVAGHRISAAEGTLRADPEYRHTRATCTA